METWSTLIHGNMEKAFPSDECVRQASVHLLFLELKTVFILHVTFFIEVFG
jgi:hypothetical protein